MRASELVLIISIALFAALLCYQSTEFRYFSPQGFGPGFVPLNFAAATLALGLLLLLKSRVRASGDGPSRRITERLKNAVPAIAAAVLLFIATYFMHFGSVFAPLFVVMVAISVAFLGHSLIRAVILNAITLAAVYAIFNLWLNIPVT